MNRENVKWILASGSPRRKKLLQMLETPFEVIVADVEERAESTEPAAVTEELSRQKAEAVADTISEGIVIGADTVVALDGRILGKPSSAREAKDMLLSLQGRSHMVYTGVTIIKKAAGSHKQSVHTFSEGTRVHIAPVSAREIEHYVASGDSMDKAGAYGIQGIFGRHIKGIEGDYYNVEGLPVHRLYEEMKRFNS